MMVNLINENKLDDYLKEFIFPFGEQREEINKIINNWQKSFLENDLQEEKETSLDGEFLSDFFCKILGYQTRNEGCDVWTLSRQLKSEADSTEADGALGFYCKNSKKTRCVIELKDAKCNLDAKQARKNNQTPVEQAFQYLTKNTGCDWAIVSNYKEIRLYYQKQNAYELFDVMKLHEEHEFRRFYFCLCKQNLFSENKNSIMDNLLKDSTEHEKQVTDDFYKDYKKLRKTLFEHICENNPGYDKKWLLEKTQKLLDRLIFIMFCEDSKIQLLQPETIKKNYERAINYPNNSDEKVYRIMKDLFISINEGNYTVNSPINKYNGGMFAEDKDLDNLIIKDFVWKDVVELANYKFESDLNVNILGHIFEKSINDLEKIRNEIDGIDFDAKKSQQKKDGVFYTPEYITKYIVEQTVGKYLEEHPDKLETIKILDPACGSGAFLNQAHSFLKQEYENRRMELVNNTKSSKKGGQEFLQLKIEKHKDIIANDSSILLDNLFGVDLNKESVEITKLALWLKTAKKDKPLQNLDANIKCGNSLIDDFNIAGDKAFNWDKEFKDIMSNGGFDIVIGNPPYVSNKTMHRIGLQNHIKYWNQKYISAKSGNYDMYILFIEQALNLLKENGYFAFIIPNKFLISKYSESLLEFINDNYEFINIFDFSKLNIFEDASVYPIIIVIKKTKTLKKSSLVKKNLMIKSDNIIIEQTISWDYLKQTSCNDKNNNQECEKIQKLINKVESINNKINDAIFEPGINGFQFSNYSKCVTDGVLKENSKLLITTGAIDPYVVLNKNIKYNGKTYTKPYIFYDKELISIGKWNLFSSPKILIAGMTKKIEAVIDENGNYAPAVSVYSVLHKDINTLKYILCILNSKLINFYFINKFQDKHLSEDYISINNTLLKKIPIPNVPNDVILEFAQKSDLLIQLNKDLQSEISSGLNLLKSYNPKKITKKLEKFYTLGIDGLLLEFKKQKVLTFPNIKEREALVNWYNEKVSKILYLQTQINDLLKAIDDKIYKLYNLSIEEIEYIKIFSI